MIGTIGSLARTAPSTFSAPVARAPEAARAVARGYDAAGFGADAFERNVRQVDFRVLSPLGHVTAPTAAIANQWARNAGNAVVVSPSGTRTVIGDGYSPSGR